ncbi:MAG: amidase family protein [Chloroflexi bacterium]|nr:amidase family protein [Chloroflexota bacterium]
MSDSDLTFAPAWKLRQLIGEKRVSPVELTELFLRRIEELNPTLNAYLTVAADQALESAREAEAAVQRGDSLGPLHGVPISIKDLATTKGIRTTRGSLLFKDFIPDEDEVQVQRIRGAGAVILGKTNTPEFGHLGTSENLLGDACRNPWDSTRTSGGSSGGAAAGLASGMHPLAHGSDGGGSIRIPASMCGVYGIKPTQGRVPKPYHGPGGWGMFGQSGPITHTVRDAAILLQVLAGPDPSDPTCLQESPPDFAASLDDGVKGLRIGWSPDLGSVAVDPEVSRVTQEAAQVFGEHGAVVEEAGFTWDHEEIRETFKTLFFSDYAAAFGEAPAARVEQMTPTFQAIIEQARQWPVSRLALALRELEWHRGRVAELFRGFDLLLTPTLATTAFPVGQRPEVIDGKAVDPFWGFNPFNFPFNMSGNTAASVPCGFSEKGLPIGLHIVGRKGAEATVLAASAVFEAARPWAGRRPPVS